MQCIVPVLKQFSPCLVIDECLLLILQAFSSCRCARRTENNKMQQIFFHGKITDKNSLISKFLPVSLVFILSLKRE